MLTEISKNMPPTCPDLILLSSKHIKKKKNLENEGHCVCVYYNTCCYKYKGLFAGSSYNKFLELEKKQSFVFYNQGC